MEPKVYNSFSDLEEVVKSMVESEIAATETHFTYVSKSEERFIKRLKRIVEQMKKLRLPFTYIPECECLQVSKTLAGKKFPYLMYIGIYDDGTFGFGGETEDLCVGNAREVAKAAQIWLNNEDPCCR